ncbi:MAG: hypothetical protein CMP49_01605 [Flavobacteriales bacterium]|jgi:gliding motility-associated-like protein|nr:hypothetical protein [Flavobacteriales bacterium]|tara:strand:- start:6784 stop:9621 length:2838 start_codon:yes stop_codon:yes gene_type:complete
MILRFLLFSFFILHSFLFSQIAVTNNAPMDSEEYLVNNVLLGDDLVTSNFSSVGYANGIGYFDGFNANIGFDEGIILSSGGLELVTNGFGAGSAISGDSDLELALNAINLNWNVNNVTILEFDFVANSESVAFNYVFGSVEYTSYTCSMFNDIFGFFLSGPGITGPYSNNAVNLAYVPDPNNPGEYTTTPVAVNTINAGELTNDPDCNDIDPDFESYNIYWIDNDYSGAGWQGVNQPPDPEFTVEGITGFTVPLTAEYNGLTCGETYHIKLAIADASDGALNSCVFLEANSFISPSVVVNPISNITGPVIVEDPSAIYEGCAAAQLEFNAAGNSEYDITLEVVSGGECEYGVDYVVTYEDGSPLDECINNDGVLSPCITIPAGEEFTYINIQAFYDDLNESFEDLQFTINAINGLCQQAELSVSEISFNLYDQVPIIVDPGSPAIIQCFGDEATLEPAVISGGYIGDTNEYTYIWYDQEGNQIGSDPSLTVNTSADTEYQLIVYDDCQDQEIVTDFSVQVIEYSAVEISYPDYFACDSDFVTVTPTVNGGSGDYSYVWPDSPTPCDCTTYDYNFELDNGNNQNVDFQIIDNCSNMIYDFSIPISLQVTEPPLVEIQVLGNLFCPGDPLNLDAQTLGTSTYSYQWLNLDMDESYVNNIASISPEETTTYEVIVIDECNGEESIFDIVIEVPIYAAPTFTVTDVVGCPGETVEIAVENLFSEGVINDDDYSFLWSNGETSSSILVDVEETTTYYSVQVGDLCNNLSEEASAMVSISVAPVPEFYFEQDGMDIQFVQLIDEQFVEFEWVFGDDSSLSYEVEPLHTYEEEGSYFVTLTAWDQFGCSNYYNEIINIAPALIFYSPDIFSPNGDGVNDTFNVSVVGQEDFELIIFDRWGKQIFSTTNPQEGWDGKYPNGKEVPQDVYMYKVYMTNSASMEKTEKGRVSIIK